MMRGGIAGLALAGLTAAALAQSTSGSTPNMMNPTPMESGSIALDLRGIAFDGDDSDFYGSGQLWYGLGNGWDLALRGTFAEETTFVGPPMLMTGGTDIEFLVRFAAFPNRENVSAYIGAAFPDTPAQDETFITYGLTVLEEQENLDILFGLRGAYNDSDNNFLGGSLGMVTPINNNWEFAGDVTVMIAGENIRSTVTGTVLKAALVNAVLRYRPGMDGNMQYYFGLGNTLGTTTGASLSAPLGNKVGLIFGVGARF